MPSDPVRRRGIGQRVAFSLTPEAAEASDSSSDWAEKIPLFTEEISRIFTVDELNTYFAATTRVGSAAHVATDDEYEFMREAGMFDDDVISGAADAILFERARALLLSEARGSQ